MDQFSKPPNDPVGAIGYEQIFEFWERLLDVGESRSLTDEDFSKMQNSVRALLTARERGFFNEPFDPSLSPAAVQANTAARLQKILMNRHGYKAF